MESAKYRFHGIGPHQIADFKALAGDRSDNLPGVKGIGELSASELLKEKEDLESIYDDLDEIAKMPFRGARRVSRLLLENKEEAFKMRDLTTIVRDVPVPIDIESSACGDLGRRLAGWDG
jgi:DNA polymerase-1